MTTHPSDEKTIALVLYPGLTALDLIGPLQVFTQLQRFAPRYRTVVVGAHTQPMGTDLPLELVAERTFADVPRPQVVVVPGGRIGTIRAMSDRGVRRYVRSTAATADVVGSVCTGSLVLGAVGLLVGRQATTNWFFAGALKPLGATYHRQRWIEDGNITMSAGVSAGIDWALHLAARLTDEATARQVQLALDYDPQPPFGGIDWTHVPPFPRAARALIDLLAPLLAAKPRRLSRAGM